MDRCGILWVFLVLNAFCLFTCLVIYQKQSNIHILPGLILSITNVACDLHPTKTSEINNSNFVITKQKRSIDLRGIKEEKIDLHGNDKCGNLSLASLSGVKMTSSGWQKIRGQQDMLVYSAFWDARLPEPSVMILGLIRESYRQNLWCLLWYEEAESAVITKARYQHVKLNKPGRYVDNHLVDR